MVDTDFFILSHFFFVYSTLYLSEFFFIHSVHPVSASGLKGSSMTVKPNSSYNFEI